MNRHERRGLRIGVATSLLMIGTAALQTTKGIGALVTIASSAAIGLTGTALAGLTGLLARPDLQMTNLSPGPQPQAENANQRPSRVRVVLYAKQEPDGTFSQRVEYLREDF